MSSAVIDAGPLIHLSELRAEDVLGDFEVLYVPPAVWMEVSKYQHDILKHPKLKLKKTEPPSLDIRLATLSQAFSLDHGEIQALALMAIYPNAIFLTDDAAARLVAEEMGYQVHGTIGLLIRAVRKGHRSPEEVLSALSDLHKKSTLYVRPGLIADVIKRLEKEWLER